MDGEDLLVERAVVDLTVCEVVVIVHLPLLEDLEGRVVERDHRVHLPHDHAEQAFLADEAHLFLAEGCAVVLGTPDHRLDARDLATAVRLLGSKPEALVGLEVYRGRVFGVAAHLV